MENTGTLQVTAPNVSAEAYAIVRMIDALMRDGFTDAPPKITRMLAVLVIKSARCGKLNLSNEYARVAEKEHVGADVVRSQLTYYIDKNKASMRETIESKGILPGEDCLSNKRFIRLLGGFYYADCMQWLYHDK